MQKRTSEDAWTQSQQCAGPDAQTPSVGYTELDAQTPTATSSELDAWTKRSNRTIVQKKRSEKRRYQEQIPSLRREASCLVISCNEQRARCQDSTSTDDSQIIKSQSPWKTAQQPECKGCKGQHQIPRLRVPQARSWMPRLQLQRAGS